jgi:hypothetical protein
LVRSYLASSRLPTNAPLLTSGEKSDLMYRADAGIPDVIN